MAFVSRQEVVSDAGTGNGFVKQVELYTRDEDGELVPFEPGGGEQGPRGPEGPEGPRGPEGPAGDDGFPTESQWDALVARVEALEDDGDA